MAFGIKILTRYDGAVPHVAKRELRRFLKEAYLTIGIYWHRFMRPKHFTEEGAKEYRYESRIGEWATRNKTKGWERTYSGKKFNKYGHTRPLEFTGKSKRNTRQRDVRATSNGCRVVLHAPALNFRNQYSKISMYREMTTVTEKEVTTLSKIFDDTVGRLLRNFRHKEVKRHAA